MAQHTRPRSQPITLTVATLLTVAALGVALYMAMVYAPTERVMGAVQRIFYFHVGAAWAGALAFLVTAVTSVLYLLTRKQRWDAIAASSAEVGVVLLTITLASGMVWANAAWGTPLPAWDPKLRAVGITWLSYLAYLLFRQGIADPQKRARFAAVYGIVAFSSVMFSYLGVRLINTAIHPVVLGGSAGVSGEDTGLSPRMAQSLMVAVAAFTLTYVTALWHRVRLWRPTS